MKNIVELSEGSFEAEVLRAPTTVLVDFYAPWCGPCKMLAPLLEEFAGEYEGKLRFVKVNVEEAQEVAGRFQITGVPTLMIFRNGQAADTMVGFRSPAALKAWLENAAGAAPAASAGSATPHGGGL